VPVDILRNAWNKLNSNEEPDFDLEGIEDDFHGAFGADHCYVRDLLHKDEEDFGYQNFMKKELHNKLKRTVQVKRTSKMRRKKKHVQASDFQK
jgi:hypothetical protein